MLVTLTVSAFASSFVLDPGVEFQHPAVTSELIVVGTIVSEDLYTPPPRTWFYQGQKVVTGQPTRLRATVRVDAVLKGDPALKKVILSVTPSYYPGLDPGVPMLLHLVPQPGSPYWSPDGTYFSIYQRLETPCG